METHCLALSGDLLTVLYPVLGQSQGLTKLPSLQLVSTWVKFCGIPVAFTIASTAIWNECSWWHRLELPMLTCMPAASIENIEDTVLTATKIMACTRSQVDGGGLTRAFSTCIGVWPDRTLFSICYSVIIN